MITFVEPQEKNREALGLDIGSEPARRSAALLAARSREATLTAPLTLVQASGRVSGGMLLLPIFRNEPRGGQLVEHLVGWSYAPLLMEDVLHGLDADDGHVHLTLTDVDHDKQQPFFSEGETPVKEAAIEAPRVAINLYGRHWEAALAPTQAFVDGLNQPSPEAKGLLAMLFGAAVAALAATLLQLVERSRAQRMEQARRAAIVGGSSDAIIVQTLDGVITDWNEGAERLFGYSKASAKGQTATALLLPDELKAEDAMIRRKVSEGGRVQVFETLRRAHDGALIPVSITASPIHDDDGRVVGAAKILRDVREAKSAEQRMRELNASLEHQVQERTARLDEAMREANEANAAESRFLANISHEIRTPMNAVIGLTHLMSRTRLDADQASMLQRVQAAGKSLMALLNDVLDLSKIEAGEMTLESVPFVLRQTIDELASIIAASAEQRGIAFSVSYEGRSDMTLLGDSARLGQVVLNLLSNAVKFTPAGSVELQVHAARALEDGRIPVSIRVSDTGIGISEEAQSRLFQPFAQADTSTTRRFGGTGLGLSIVRQLVDLMGGSIVMSSRPNEGSSFVVNIALMPGTEAAPQVDATGADAAASASLALKHASILVVDDNALNREIAMRILVAEGARVIEAGNGAQAVSLIRAADTPIDLVLMDVQMPVMDGLEATRQIRALRLERSQPTIIGLTAGVSADERKTALAAGMDAVIGKPFEPELLLATLVRHLTPSASPGPRQAGGAALPTPAQAERAPPDWPALPGTDAHRSFQRLKGDHGLFRRMALAARDTLQANAILARSRGTQEPPWREHARALHDFKSIAGTLGAGQLQALAGRAEQAIGAGDLETASAAMSELAELGAGFAAAVEALYPRPESEALEAGDIHPARPQASEPVESGALSQLLVHMGL